MRRTTVNAAVLALSCALLAGAASAKTASGSGNTTQGPSSRGTGKTSQATDGLLARTSQLDALCRFRGKYQDLQRNVRLLVSEDGQAESHHTSMLPVGPRGQKVPVETVVVTQGRADAILGTGPQRGVLLQSSDQVQAITTRGRVAMIAHEGRVAVAAIDGPALVGRKGVFKPLLEGGIRVFLSNGTSTDSVLPASPTATTQGLPVSLQGGAEISLASTPVAGASIYRALVVDEAGQLIARADSKDPAGFHLNVPRAGRYWAVTQAVDENGFGGEPSKPLPIRVLGVENGAELVRDGFIYLAPGESARILGQQGLLMRYGASPDFIPAPTSIALPSRKATTVEFRDPTNPLNSALFRLAPRVLKTHIGITPRGGTWPGDDLRLSVRMWDGQGTSLSWMDDYKVVVKVGVAEVPVDWIRQGNYLKATVAPQPGPGPWVVRVSIRDQAGEEVARNFVEVAEGPARPAAPDSTQIASSAP